MNASEFVSLLGERRALVILRATVEEAAGPAMEAAVSAGFRVLEFTLNTPGALARIQEFSRREGLVVGAGTVLDRGDVRRAVDAGARFLVSPVVDETVIREGVEAGVAVIPGAQSPTEMLRAHRAGATLLKLFPAPGTGPAFVRACLGPLPFLRIVPTNDIDASNAGTYLGAGAFAVGFGNRLFDPGEMRRGEFGRIEERAKEMLAAVAAARRRGLPQTSV
jgi:2-dehydro-3-deoxyphosphogluconate aldolase/(4S)-4-hydroxy-2-oxoglutarate aldolase